MKPLFPSTSWFVLGATTARWNQKVDEVTGGFWWKFYRGALGNAQFGLQLGYIQRIAIYE